METTDPVPASATASRVNLAMATGPSQEKSTPVLVTVATASTRNRGIARAGGA